VVLNERQYDVDDLPFLYLFSSHDCMNICDTRAYIIIFSVNPGHLPREAISEIVSYCLMGHVSAI